MSEKLDQYYTPTCVAEKLVADCVLPAPSTCIDTTCGHGSLLSAAVSVFPSVKCFGVDVDRSSILTLRESFPSWTLRAGNVLKPQGLRTIRNISPDAPLDWLLLNPPFSQNNQKFIEFSYERKKVRASVAMAYLLQSLESVKPRFGGLVLLPESAWHSDIDRSAREYLENGFSLNLVNELSGSTFDGARANSVVVEMSPKLSENSTIYRPSRLRRRVVHMRLLRGGLPRHEAVLSAIGIPYIHTTDISDLASSNVNSSKLPLVEPISRGQAKGWVILLPRLGALSKGNVVPIFLGEISQLSDCVLALQLSCESDAKSVCRKIRREWPDYAALYRGTGARYITMQKFRRWFEIRYKGVV